MMFKTLLVLVVHLLVTPQLIGAYNHQSCYDDVDGCTKKLRILMMDESELWFGSGYVRRCPPYNTDIGCTNPNKVGRSILARVYNTTDDASLGKVAEANNKLALANVRFDVPKGSYYGCGHHYESPAMDFKLDPTSVMTVNSWALDHLPEITWDADDNTYYTVLIWDVGYFYSHGIYTNAMGGNLNTATVIDPYHGPRNPWFRPNVFLFAVFRQTMMMDPGMTRGIVGSIMGQYQAALPLSVFLESMKTYIEGLEAANVMLVVGDAYAMELQKKSYITYTCPMLISQTPELRTVFNGAGIPVSWSQPSTTLGYNEVPHISTLTTDLRVEYFMTSDMMVDSCCVKTTFTQSLYRPDPLHSQVARPALTSRAPRVEIDPIYILTQRFNGIKDQVYTLMMVDMTDALYRRDNPSFIIHWMVNDIRYADVSKGHETLPYMGPNPFDSNEPRTYVFLLLQQKDDVLDTSKLADFVSDKCPGVIYQRCGAQLSRMMQAWNLEQIVGVTWFQAEQDAFARKRLYSDWMLKKMIDVCDGQPGFEDPCPNEQFCGSGNAGTSLTAALTTSIFLALVSSLLY